jgi:hypothetical protein
MKYYTLECNEDTTLMEYSPFIIYTPESGYYSPQFDCVAATLRFIIQAQDFSGRFWRIKEDNGKIMWGGTNRDASVLLGEC